MIGIEERACLMQVPQGGVFFDVGACSGEHSEALLARNRTASVHAFEPHPNNVRYLRRLSGVRVTQAVVSDRTGEARLYGSLPVPADNPNGFPPIPEHARAEMTGPPDQLASLSPRPYHHDDAVFSVPSIRLDDYAARAGVGRVDLLKVDVEGHELEVLEGAGGLRVDVILFEALDPDAWLFADGYLPELGRVLGLLRSRGYVVEAWVEGQWTADVESPDRAPNLRAWLRGSA